jgi:hypothetical protein
LRNSLWVKLARNNCLSDEALCPDLLKNKLLQMSFDHDHYVISKVQVSRSGFFDQAITSAVTDSLGSRVRNVVLSENLFLISLEKEDIAFEIYLDEFSEARLRLRIVNKLPLSTEQLRSLQRSFPKVIPVALACGRWNEEGVSVITLGKWFDDGEKGTRASIFADYSLPIEVTTHLSEITRMLDVMDRLRTNGFYIP